MTIICTIRCLIKFLQQYGSQITIKNRKNCDFGACLASTVLGLVQSSKPKRKIESYLSLILAVATVSLAYAAYLVIVFGSGIIKSVGRGEPFFWVYFSLVLAPSLLIYAHSIKFLTSKERLDFLTNQKVRIATFAALAAVPLSYTTILLLLMYLL